MTQSHGQGSRIWTRRAAITPAAVVPAAATQGSKKSWTLTRKYESDSEVRVRLGIRRRCRVRAAPLPPPPVIEVGGQHGDVTCAALQTEDFDLVPQATRIMRVWDSERQILMANSLLIYLIPLRRPARPSSPTGPPAAHYGRPTKVKARPGRAAPTGRQAVRGGVQERGCQCHRDPGPHAESRTPCVADHV